ncbi:hypothetical protein Droror1_Dr00027890 [Drosera rotundifolia]
MPGKLREVVSPGGCSEQSKWELNKPVPLNEDGSFVEAALGSNPDVHYIYVCTKPLRARRKIKPAPRQISQTCFGAPTSAAGDASPFSAFLNPNTTATALRESSGDLSFRVRVFCDERLVFCEYDERLEIPAEI